MLTKIVISTFLITTLFYQIQCEEDFWILKSNFSKIEDECTQPGWKCKDCKSSIVCKPRPDGSFDAEHVQCPADQTCFASDGQCKYEPNKDCPSNSTVKFTCIQQGIFADPYDCKKYYICIKLKDDIFTEDHVDCDEGWIFNLKTGRCSDRFVSDATTRCPEILPECKYEYDIQDVKGNPRMYIICEYKPLTNNTNVKVLYPEQYYCNNGFIFSDSHCIDPTPESGLDENRKCIAEGTFYYPDDCILYVECTGSDPTPKYKTCGVGFKFNPYIKKCENLYCRNCD